MYKIRSVSFKGHPVLGDLKLDFTGPDGRAVDTVIIAGENGCGKSTVLEELYNIMSAEEPRLGSPMEMVIECPNGSNAMLSFYDEDMGNGATYTYVNDGHGIKAFFHSDRFRQKYPTAGIYSAVDINFASKPIQTVTSNVLDGAVGSRRSTENLSTEVNQLIVDVQALDAADVETAVENNPNILARDLPVERRMPRFTKAFATMFDGLEYSRVTNADGHKAILFKKGGVEIPIEHLSSGEKQIIYRGCFLLRDANALTGAFVFIDEPEISLHPRWQKKIMDYYKGIFTDSNGFQTSQIFAVTHSPFVVHNETRHDDKVIVLERGADGTIRVASEPAFYACDSERAVESAFRIRDLAPGVSSVYVEGRTDERYFNKALEVFGLTESSPFRFKWVGYMDERKQEKNTGSSSLNKALDFLKGHSTVRNACLFDCDTGHKRKVTGNVLELSMPCFDNETELTKGIENALVLPRKEVDQFFTDKPIEGDGGRKGSKPELDKMKLCDHVCSKPDKELRIVFSNLRQVIDDLEGFFSGERE